MNLKVKEKDINTYNDVFGEEDKVKRSEKAQLATDNFYTLITKFYEKGWGQSFHFAPRYEGESFEDSIKRHEAFLAVRLELKPDDTVLDVGCGVMGPARNLARLSGANITGLTINQHQVDRCTELNASSSVSHLLNVQQGDYMKMPFPENSFDKMYAIEALCHAPHLQGVYEQIYSRLKPGGRACFYQWAMTDKYDPDNAEHVKAKDMIEYGNSITRLKTIDEIDETLEASPLTVVETLDVVEADLGNDMPWYSTLQAGWSLSQIRHTKVSRTMVGTMLRTFETLKVFPKGISDTQKLLLVAADGLVKGGELGIFTPMYLIVVEKQI
jgi:sterol 24-C-methyltransferase